MRFYRLQNEHYCNEKTQCCYGCFECCYMYSPKYYYTWLYDFYGMTLSTKLEGHHMIHLNSIEVLI